MAATVETVPAKKTVLALSGETTAKPTRQLVETTAQLVERTAGRDDAAWPGGTTLM